MPEACPCAALRTPGRKEQAPDANTFVCHHLDEPRTAREFVRPLALDWPSVDACVCRACGTRWVVLEHASSSDNSPSPDTLEYEWRELAWSDEDLGRALRELPGRKAERRLAAASARAAAMEDSKRREREAVERTIAQDGPGQWRWVDPDGTAHGCRIDDWRLVVWTVRTPSVWVDDRAGSDDTEVHVRAFLDGYCPDLLPPPVADRVRAVLHRTHGGPRERARRKDD